MKKVLISILLLLAVLLARGQELFPLVDEKNQWLCGYEIPDGFSSYSIKLENDTLINDVIYKKVIRSFESDGSEPHTLGYMREDSTKKVYFMNTLFETGLIYDFGVEKGDTIEINNMHTTDWWDMEVSLNDDLKVVVDSIYFLEVPDENNRRVFKIRKLNGTKTEIWIEGIGSMAGILKSGHNAFCCPWGNYLMCFEENNEIIFKNPDHPFAPSCWVIYTNTDELQIGINDKSYMSIYPNPVCTNFFVIKHSRKFSGYIMLFSSKGQMVYFKKQDVSTLETTVNLPDIPAGVYILNTKRLTGEKDFKKIIIQTQN